jgi:hypothetical protein
VQHATRGFTRGLRGVIFTTSMPAPDRTAQERRTGLPACRAGHDGRHPHIDLLMSGHDLAGLEKLDVLLPVV